MRAFTRFFPASMLICIAWGALAFAAVYPWAFLPLAAAMGLIGIWALIQTRTAAPLRFDPMLLALGAAVIGIGVQTVPLPYELFARLSPAADRYLQVRYLRFQPGSTHALSLSPADTTLAFWLMLGLILGYAGVVRGVAVVKLDRIVRGLLILGVGLALIAVIQKATIDPNDPLVYGFWKPRQKTMPYGPFINRNHFAGWMVMAVPIAMAYSFAVFQESARPRAGDWRGWLLWLTRAEANRFALVAVSILAMGASLVLSGSRSGIASFVVAVATFALFLGFRIRRERHRSELGWLAAAYLLVLVVGAIAWAGVGQTVDRFSLATADMPSRLRAWGDTRRIIGDFPWFGVGVGAFGPAMIIYQSFGRPAIYYQAHNEYLELFAEGGLLIAIPIVIAAAIFVARVIRRLREGDLNPTRYWIRIGAVAGLAGIAAQSTVEFSLQMPGDAVLFVLLAAIAAHESRRDDSGRPTRAEAADAHALSHAR